MSRKVYVGMSGGVDSSLAAALLKEQGYDVTGVYMKNWTQDLPGMVCPWAEDLADAKRVAVQLDIPFKVFDFESEYKQKVVDYMVAEYESGRTPNPDIMCNQEVKFKLFLKTALEDGADMIATGHYAIVDNGRRMNRHSPAKPRQSTNSELPLGRREPSPEKAVQAVSQNTSEFQDVALLAGIDTSKDQTYFLYRITEEALSKTLFPLGELAKDEVRKMAEERGLITAGKKDSQGICFIGQVGIKEFLGQYVKTEPGKIVDKANGQVLGYHDGAIFYTMGQRHGLDVGGGLPYYVIGKDMAKNEVYVTTNLNDDSLWRHELEISDTHWINDEPQDGKTYNVRLRYRAPLIKAGLQKSPDGSWRISLHEPERAITPGQSAVVYDGDRVAGGGIVI